VTSYASKLGVYKRVITVFQPQKNRLNVGLSMKVVAQDVSWKSEPPSAWFVAKYSIHVLVYFRHKKTDLMSAYL
jgi:hypothetical protein